MKSTKLTGAIASAILAAVATVSLPSHAESTDTSNQPSVHKISHADDSLQKALSNSSATPFKWGQPSPSPSVSAQEIASDGYKWDSASPVANQPSSSYSEQARNRWRRSSSIEQSRNRWRRSSHVEQTRNRWRS